MKDQFETVILSALFHNIRNFFPGLNEVIMRKHGELDSISPECQSLIQYAAELASGMVDTLHNTALQAKSGEDFQYPTVRLKPVFESVALDKSQMQTDKYQYNLKPFYPDKDSIFPMDKNTSTESNLEQLYNELMKDFEIDFNLIEADNLFYLIECYLSLLEKYTWCIPNSISEKTDVSLYDHSKITGAIAACLYQYHNDGEIIKTADLQNNGENKFILVGGDLSGIQNYIFDLVQVNLRKVSKTLRARSFYLSALPKILVTKILFEKELVATNSLMETGGRFILLMPNIDDVKLYLRKFRNELNEWCMNEFHGELTVGLDWSVELSGNDFFEKKFWKKLGQLNHNMETLKLLKYDFKRDLDWEDSGFVVGLDYEKLRDDTTELCRTCGKRPVQTEIEEQGESLQVCGVCYRQQIIGGELAKTSIVSISQQPTTTQKLTDKGFHFEIGNSLYSFSFHRTAEELDNINDYITAFKLSEEAEIKPKKFMPRHLLANYVPRFDESEIDGYRKYYKEQEITPEEYKHINVKAIKTFSDIAIPENKLINSDDSTGTHYLAIIKADVDNLGLIFNTGLGEDLSIARFATLSRMMNAFFCGYLNLFLEDNYPNIYTVYAGGDDLFLIGNWKDIIHFAPDFNKEFREYTCQNSDIHLSAGIELIKQRSPIRKGAERAEVSLEMAKGQVDENESRKKNKFTLFQTVLDWDEWENWLRDWIEFFDTKLHLSKSSEDGSQGKTKINSAFLYRLLRYQEMAQSYLKGRKIEGLLYLSHLSYDIGRNIWTSHEDNPDIENEIRKLNKLFDLNNNTHLIQKIHVPIYYSLYKHRGGQ